MKDELSWISLSRSMPRLSVCLSLCPSILNVLDIHICTDVHFFPSRCAHIYIYIYTHIYVCVITQACTHTHTCIVHPTIHAYMRAYSLHPYHTIPCPGCRLRGLGRSEKLSYMSAIRGLEPSSLSVHIICPKLAQTPEALRPEFLFL